MKKYLYITFIFVLLLYSKCNGQFLIDTTKIFLVETVDGNEYVGKIMSDDASIIVLKTDVIGTISINRKNISKIREIKKEQIIEGNVWYENIQSTRYYWAPNGYGLKKGEGYYQNMWILYNQAGYGFSDKFSVGVGLIPLFLFAADVTPIWITPKLSLPIQKDKLNLGLGVLAATVIGEEDVSFGIAYGVSTFGSRDKNLSIGLGYGYANGNWASRPIIMLGTMMRTGKKGYFMSENYYIKAGNDALLLFGLGGRSLIKKVALDYGLIIPMYSEMEAFVAIPWLGITIPIESKQ